MTWSVGQVTLSYSLKYLRYLMISLSIIEFTNMINTNLYNNALYIPAHTRGEMHHARNVIKMFT